jgi:hypothetical protein
LLKGEKGDKFVENSWNDIIEALRKDIPDVDQIVRAE